MNYTLISVVEEGDFAGVTMRCPEKRNALSESHLRELLHGFQTVGESAARGVILASEGPVFCAGHDFADMEGRSLPEMRRLLSLCRDLMRRATRGSALSKGLGKQAFYRQVDLDTRAAYDFATEVMAAASQTEDAQENLNAFLEKRRAHFVDR